MINSVLIMLHFISKEHDWITHSLCMLNSTELLLARKLHSPLLSILSKEFDKIKHCKLYANHVTTLWNDLRNSFKL